MYLFAMSVRSCNVKTCVFYNILSHSIVFFSSWCFHFGINYTAMDLPVHPEYNGVCPKSIKLSIHKKCLIFITIGMHINGYIISLAT